MKRHFKFMIPIMAICMAILCGVTMHLIIQVQSYGRLINHVGIVRGASQRLVKLELNNIPSDEIMLYLDGILKELTTGEGPIGLERIQDATYNHDLDALNHMWDALKTNIQEVRNGNAETKLLLQSEEFFRLADDTVFTVELYSNHQTKRLSVLILAMVVAMAITWSIILSVYFKHLLQLENTNQDLSDKAYRDALTGAPNLEKFRSSAQLLLEKPTKQNIAIFYIDIDNFKYYNDVFGLQYGDEILKKYTEFLWCDMSGEDIFCRVSSDNFLALRCYKNKDELVQRQETVDREIAQYVLQTKEQHLFTLSCGICCTEDLSEEHQINSLIERANFARKTVKNKAMNHYAFYSESIRDKMLSEKAIENRMHEAVQNQEFVVFLQPKISLKTGKITCAEALVRWIMPDKTIINPDQFIPIFEKNLFISTLDQYVLESVCKWLRQQMDAGLCVLPISVNVSRTQLYDPDFVKLYAAIKNRYNIPADMLEVEFTESMVFENLDTLLDIIAELKKAGFRCSLDDFGKGYSSLNLLRKLPVDVLKLDKLFFAEDNQPEKARTIIIGMVSMVRSLKIEIVAEGVEREEQVAFLREIGCDLVQGYVFYRPMPVAELEQLLAEDALAQPHSVL